MLQFGGNATNDAKIHVAYGVAYGGVAVCVCGSSPVEGGGGVSPLIVVGGSGELSW